MDQDVPVPWYFYGVLTGLIGFLVWLVIRDNKHTKEMAAFERVQAAAPATTRDKTTQLDIWLLRHAEDDRPFGQGFLTEKGREQAGNAGSYVVAYSFKNNPVIVLHSPVGRCAQTARIIAEEAAAALCEPLDDLRGTDFFGTTSAITAFYADKQLEGPKTFVIVAHAENLIASNGQGCDSKDPYNEHAIPHHFSMQV